MRAVRSGKAGGGKCCAYIAIFYLFFGPKWAVATTGLTLDDDETQVCSQLVPQILTFGQNKNNFVGLKYVNKKLFAFGSIALCCCRRSLCVTGVLLKLLLGFSVSNLFAQKQGYTNSTKGLIERKSGHLA